MDRKISLFKVEDAATETFELFAEWRQHGSDLGMIAPKESTIDISIANHDFSIVQSPGLLRSNHAQGTTGAAAWQSGVRFATWLAQVDNPLVQHGLVAPKGAVLELGAGAAGLVSSIIAGRITPGGRVVASDMDYVLKLMRQNITANLDVMGKQKTMRARLAHIDVVKLDWEQDDAKSLLNALGMTKGVDLIVACDCIYNYALLEPFIETCTAICEMRTGVENKQHTSCLIVQHLRQADVFEAWLSLALPLFEVRRMPADLVGDELSAQCGFAVHLLSLRQSEQ